MPPRPSVYRVLTSATSELEENGVPATLTNQYLLICEWVDLMKKIAKEHQDFRDLLVTLQKTELGLFKEIMKSY